MPRKYLDFLLKSISLFHHTLIISFSSQTGLSSMNHLTLDSWHCSGFSLATSLFRFQLSCLFTLCETLSCYLLTAVPWLAPILDFLPWLVITSSHLHWESLLSSQSATISYQCCLLNISQVVCILSTVAFSHPPSIHLLPLHRIIFQI